MNCSIFDLFSVLSLVIGLENLQENREQSAQQENIINALNEKFDRLENTIKEMIRVENDKNVS